MITFRLTRQSFTKNSFFTRKTTPIAKTSFSFGYIKFFDKRNNAIVEWYDSFTKVELKFSMRELCENYKSIYPYFNNRFMRGNIHKCSYLTLLTKIDKEVGFIKVKVDKVNYRKTPVKGNKVLISDAVYVLSNKINTLEGKLIKIQKGKYYVRTKQGVFSMNRNNFKLLPQDFFTVLSIRCN